MGLVSFAMTSMRELGNQYDVEAEIQEITRELSQIQQLGSILADGKINPNELSGLDFDNIPLLERFSKSINQRNLNNRALFEYSKIRKDFSEPMDPNQVLSYIKDSILEKIGHAEEQKLHAREKQLMMKKDRLEKRLKMIEANKKANDQGFDAAVKNFAPKFPGAQG